MYECRPPGACSGVNGAHEEQVRTFPSGRNTRHPRTIEEYGTLALRVLRRGIEAAHVVGWCALDGPSRRNLLRAYAALARGSWSPMAADARVRLGGTAVTIRFRERDIYAVGEMLHDHQYRLHSELPARPLIVDAGANIGLSALWFGVRYPGARLYCFEPEARCFDLLQHNLRQLPGVTCEIVPCPCPSRDPKGCGTCMYCRWDW